MDRRIDEVLALMRNNLHRRLTVDEMAGAVGVSPSRLRQLFRTQTGTSPVRYLSKLRMQRAKELLETTFLSVKEIAAKGGTSSISHFVADFERTYGRSPAEHRARHRSGHRRAKSHSRNGQ